MRAANLGEALTRAGFNTLENNIRFVAVNFIRAGGTREQWLAAFDAAERMPGAGQIANVSTETASMVPASRQQVEGREARTTVPQGHRQSASLPSPDRAPRTIVDVPQGQVANILPARDPKPQRPPIDFGAASHAVKTKLANSVMDRVKTNDGRSWGDVGAHELDSMTRDGALAEALKNHIGVLSNRQRFMTIRELVTAETFETLRSAAHGA